MKQIILKLKEEIKKSSTMSEGVTWYNTQEDNKIINEIEDFLILHNAQLQYILNELQLFNGDTVKLVKGCSILVKVTDCTTYNINKNCIGCPFSLHPE